MSTLWANGDRGLISTAGQQSSCALLFNLKQEFYQAQPSSSRKNLLSLHFFTILHHSRSTNVHYMGKWRQGLNIDRGATKQRAVLFNLKEEFHPAQPSSSTKNSLSHLFSQFCIIPGQQMSNLWPNEDTG